LVARQQVRVGLVVEHFAVKLLGQQVGASVIGRQELGVIEHVQNGPDEPVLQVVVKHLLGVILEDTVAEHGIVGRGKAATGYGRNDVHLVEQPPAFPFPDDFRVPQFFEHPVRERRGPGSSAGKGQYHVEAVRIALALVQIRKPVSLALVHLLQRLVLIGQGSASRGQEEDNKKR